MTANMIKNKLLPYFTITIIISLSPSILFAQELKPDLIITKVTARTFIPERKHKPIEPVRSGGRREMIEYTITIKNIGTADFSEPFYLSWQRDPFTDDEHYSRTNLVNEEYNIIPIGDSIEVKIVDGINARHYGSDARFLINTDGKPHKGSALPKIEELNYENNTYMY